MIRLRPGLRWAVIGAVTLLAACASIPTPTVDPAAEVAGLLEGRYSSQRQSHMDPAYFDVRLGMRRIWRERTGEHWLYVEKSWDTQKLPTRALQRDPARSYRPICLPRTSKKKSQRSQAPAAP